MNSDDMADETVATIEVKDDGGVSGTKLSETKLWYTGLRTMSMISPQEYAEITPEEDQVVSLKEKFPSIVMVLLAQFNKWMKDWSIDTYVYEIKCKMVIYPNSVRWVYFTREHTGVMNPDRWMRYAIGENPLCIYNAFEIRDIDRMHYLKITRLPIPCMLSGPNMSIEEYLNLLSENKPTFTEIELTNVKRAMNDFCQHILRGELDTIRNLAEIVIKFHGRLVPFCEVCGTDSMLWRFKDNFLVCTPCFNKEFDELPIKADKVWDICTLRHAIDDVKNVKL